MTEPRPQQPQQPQSVIRSAPKVIQEDDATATTKTTTTTTAKIPSTNLCKVCHGASTGVHYGVTSCEGCKAFFKRAICQYATSKCYFGGTCAITPETRGRCKACRLQKCLSEGMELDGTKVGRGRGLRRLRAQEHKQQVSSSAPTRLLPAAHLYHQLEGASVSGFPRMSEDNNSHEKSLILRGSATESLLTSPYHTGNGRPLIFLQTPDVLKRSSYHAAPSAEQKDASGSGNGNSPTGTEDDEKGDEPTFDFTLGACLDRAMDKELNNCRHNAAMARRYDHGRLSMMSNYLALLAQRNKRLEDTVGGVTEAVSLAYRGQIEDWSRFMNGVTPDQECDLKRDATIEIMGVALRNSVENDSELLVDFCRTLPGFSELSRPEQLRRISAKYSSAWLLHRAPYVRNQELFTLIDNHHYGRYWMEALLDPNFVEFLFQFMAEVNALNMTLSENYLLLAVIILQPTPALCDKDSIQYVKFLYSHYLDALTHLFGSRRSDGFTQLRSVLRKAMVIDALHARYVSILDFSRFPIRPSNGLCYSPKLLDLPDEKAS